MLTITLILIALSQITIANFDNGEFIISIKHYPLLNNIYRNYRILCRKTISVCQFNCLLY